MPKRKKSLFEAVNGAFAEIHEHLAALKPALDDMPRIPPTGGQAYYNEQRAYVQEHVHPGVGALLVHRAALGDALDGLRDFLTSKDHSSGAKDEVRSFLAVKAEEARQLDGRLRDELGNIQRDHDDPLGQLFELLDG